MSATVFANGMSIACKVASGKTIAAMPDVCLTPPSPPVGPIPVPYPNTAAASDTDKGSTTVSIGGEPVMLKDQSIFKTSTGNEAATRNLGMGVVTHKITGEAQFVAWSMNIKIEEQNVPRHMDLMGHNEACVPSQTGPWPYIDTASMSPNHPCATSVAEEKAACAPPGSAPSASGKGLDCNAACQSARACALPKKKDDKAVCCRPHTTGDHLVEVNCFTQTGTRGGLNIGSKAQLANVDLTGLAAPKSNPRRLSGLGGYDDEEAPTACANPDGTKGKHAQMQAARDRIKRSCKLLTKGVPLDVFITGEHSFWTYDQAAAAGARSHKLANPQCNEACTRAQLDNYHHDILPGNTPKEKNATPLRTYIPQR